MSRNKFSSLWFAFICLLIFLIQNIVSGFTDKFILSENALNMPWQFITAIFLHGSLIHLLYNLFALIIFGFILEQLMGTKKFILLFLISGMFANFISFWNYPNALGASGAIMAVLGCLAILKPMMNVWAFGMIIPMFIASILWAVGSILGIYGFGDSGIGHLAHLSGLLIGTLYGVYLKLRNKQRKIFEKKIVISDKDIRKWEDIVKDMNN